MGADGIELDVHLSADRQIVVIHNGTVDATTDGRGRVCDLALDELQSLDAGSWFSPRFAGQRIPTLEQVFADVGQRLSINVEIKGQLGRRTTGQLETAVVQLIEAHKLVERVIVSSFFPSSLRWVRRLNPDIPLGYLYAGRVYKRLPLPVYRLLAPFDALHPAFNLVDAAYAARLGRGTRLNVWTVNDEADLRRMCELGVTGIITNYPDRLACLLAEG
jgi:glycerophosphoryl diester phosphodiesterase